MKDIQSQVDIRRINIKKVGVKKVPYPITVKDKAQKIQHTIAIANLYVNLPHKFKGTHMSRFVEILNEFHGEITIKRFSSILAKMKERLDAEASHLELEFPYFLKCEKNGRNYIAHYQCAMHGSLLDEEEFTLTIDVPISLPILEKKQQRLPGSMGRWGTVKVSVRFNQFLWIEDLLLLIEKAVERELNDGPQESVNTLSVESLSKTVASGLEDVQEIEWFSVSAHNYGDDFSTFAAIESC
ncbi:MAG: GTP cyclohydrolase I [Desulforhopalus sp.]|jgi:GTP cyclohydrolase I